MYGFRCAQFPKPEYTLLQRLRKDVLGDGCTQRAAIATALRVTAEVVREGGARRVVQHYDEFRSVAPSERRDDLLPEEEILAALAGPSRSPEPPPTVAEEPTETVILRREVSVNGERSRQAAMSCRRRRGRRCARLRRAADGLFREING